MKNKLLIWSLIIILLLSSPFIYAELQAYVTIHFAFPVKIILSAKSFNVISIIFIVSGAISAILTSVVVALPCAYLAWGKNKTVCAFFIVLTQAIPTYTFFHQPTIKTFTAVVFAGELIAFIVAASIFADVGSRLGRRHHRAEVKRSAADGRQ